MHIVGIRSTECGWKSFNLVGYKFFSTKKLLIVVVISCRLPNTPAEMISKKNYGFSYNVTIASFYLIFSRGRKNEKEYFSTSYGHGSNNGTCVQSKWF